MIFFPRSREHFRECRGSNPGRLGEEREGYLCAMPTPTCASNGCPLLSENSSKWLERKAAEQQLGNLNDEVENLKAEKKKLRAVLDEKEAAIKSKDTEISNLEREVKSLIQVSSFRGQIYLDPIS